MKKVAIIIGSSRPGRIGANVSHWVMTKLPQNDDVSYEIIDLKEWNLPMFDEVMPPMMGQYQNDHTKKWAAKISEFTGFVFVSPEYNAGYSAATKNAIDYLKAEWEDKAVTIVIYGYGGGASANHQLAEVFTRLKMKLTATLPAMPFTQDAFGPDFQIKDMEATFGNSSAAITKAGNELIALL